MAYPTPNPSGSTDSLWKQMGSRRKTKQRLPVRTGAPPAGLFQQGAMIPAQYGQPQRMRFLQQPPGMAGAGQPQIGGDEPGMLMGPPPISLMQRLQQAGPQYGPPPPNYGQMPQGEPGIGSAVNAPGPLSSLPPALGSPTFGTGFTKLGPARAAMETLGFMPARATSVSPETEGLAGQAAVQGQQDWAQQNPQAFGALPPQFQRARAMGLRPGLDINADLTQMPMETPGQAQDIGAIGLARRGGAMYGGGTGGQLSPEELQGFDRQRRITAHNIQYGQPDISYPAGMPPAAQEEARGMGLQPDVRAAGGSPAAAADPWGGTWAQSGTPSLVTDLPAREFAGAGPLQRQEIFGSTTDNRSLDRMNRIQTRDDELQMRRERLGLHRQGMPHGKSDVLSMRAANAARERMQGTNADGTPYKATPTDYAAIWGPQAAAMHPESTGAQQRMMQQLEDRKLGLAEQENRMRGLMGIMEHGSPQDQRLAMQQYRREIDLGGGGGMDALPAMSGPEAATFLGEQAASLQNLGIDATGGVKGVEDWLFRKLEAGENILEADLAHVSGLIPALGAQSPDRKGDLGLAAILGKPPGQGGYLPAIRKQYKNIKSVDLSSKMKQTQKAESLLPATHIGF